MAVSIGINIEGATVHPPSANLGCVHVFGRRSGDFFLHAGQRPQDVAAALRDLAAQIDAASQKDAA